MKGKSNRLIYIIIIIYCFNLFSGCAKGNTLSDDAFFKCIINGVSYTIKNEIYNVSKERVETEGYVTPFIGGGDSFNENNELVAPYDEKYLSAYGSYGELMLIQLKNGWHIIEPDPVQPIDFVNELLSERNIKFVNEYKDSDNKAEGRYFSQGYLNVGADPCHKLFYEFFDGKCIAVHDFVYSEGELKYSLENPNIYSDEKGFHNAELYDLYVNDTPFTYYSDQTGYTRILSSEKDMDYVIKLYNLENLGVMLRLSKLELHKV